MRRIEAIAAVDAAFAGRPLVMTCGAPCRELASLGRRPTHLYLLDSMGLAGAVGLGLALAGKGPLAAVEGDGSLLMGLSVLASIGFHRPPGLTLVVLDNREHASAARMPSQAAGFDLAALCRATGLPFAEASDTVELEAVLAAARLEERAQIVYARVEGGNEAGIPLLLEDPTRIAHDFTRSLADLAP
jgi:sulfopyruvate decarboxylase subunit beta